MVLGTLFQLVGGAGVMALTAGGLSLALHSKTKGALPDTIMVANVSRRFVEKHLKSYPQLVAALNELSNACDLSLDETPTFTLRELVLNIVQVVHNKQALVRMNTKEDLITRRNTIRRAYEKARRRIFKLFAQLREVDACDSSMGSSIATVKHNLQQMMNGADITVDELLAVVQTRSSSTQKERQAIINQAARITAASAKKQIPFNDNLAQAVGTLAGWTDDSDDKAKARYYIHKIIKNFKRLHHQHTPQPT